MGGGCTKSLINNDPVEKIKKESDFKKLVRSTSLLNSRSPLITAYRLFQYKNSSNFTNTNTLIYTSYDNVNNDFNILDDKLSEIIRSNIYKTNGVAVGYSKGNKIDPNVQDKFFILLDGNVEVFCIVDGHGPYGNILAQNIQDKLFKEIAEYLYLPEFETNYIEILDKIFKTTQHHILNTEDKLEIEYDCYLSGGVTTLVVVKDNYIYCANVGNINASLFFTEKIYSFKFKVLELSTDDSAMAFDETSTYLRRHSIGDNNNTESQETKKNIPVPNFTLNKDYKLNKNFDKFEEVKRIYESGGEIRELAGEDKARIFVKGKYYPALITSRSIGDEIASQIGVKAEPHIIRYKLDEKINYYLVMCTDGIHNAVKIDDVVNIIENNDVLFLESITQIIQQAKNEYPKNSYTPDMTILLRNLSFNKKN